MASSYKNITADKIKTAKIPKYPKFPELPAKLLDAFPDLKKWQEDYKKWLDEYTESILRAAK